MLIHHQQQQRQQPTIAAAAPLVTEKAFSDPSTPITASVTPTNDNSNPQQGTCGSDRTMTGTAENNNAASVSTPSITSQEQQQPEEVSVGDVHHASNGPMANGDNYDSTPGYINTGYTKDARKLFVGGLPQDITEPEFRDFFTRFGELKDAIVMFDRETKTSRGFGFVTFVDPQVAQSLLRMGDRDDGIGRLVMKGKTCEVKAATPKGEGGYSRSFHARGGGLQHRSNLQHGHHLEQQQQQQQHLNNHHMLPFAYAEPMGYPMMQNAMGGAMGVPHHLQYEGCHLASIPPYGTAPAMYYPTMHSHPTVVYPAMDPGVVPGSPAAHPHYYMHPVHPTVASADPSGAVPPNVAPDYYAQALPTYHQQPTFAFVPVGSVATVPSAMANPATVPHMQTSVMQPVAPGIPGKTCESNPPEDITE